ncbi:hypothetical protein RI844_14565 [Thalassotalea fonticola]|uniref:Choice-of-anchor D domain-containing protein n=1 Tax=Thalassotalea fonticola TaxID=3065649 RepID=A0ABZ0GL03_9GAMM|nr:hypothetical protein RI844_14565 [Colwelliaceae bacterium S1-1]
MSKPNTHSLTHTIKYGLMCLALCSPFANANNTFDITTTELVGGSVTIAIDADGHVRSTETDVANSSGVIMQTLEATGDTRYSIVRFTVPGSVDFSGSPSVILELVTDRVNKADKAAGVNYTLHKVTNADISVSAINALTYQSLTFNPTAVVGADFTVNANNTVHEIDLAADVTASGDYAYVIKSGGNSAYLNFDTSESTENDSGNANTDIGDSPRVVIETAATPVEVTTNYGFSVSPSTFVVNADKTDGNSSQVFTVTNHGELPLLITSLNPNAGFFANDSYTEEDVDCVDVELAQGATCTFKMTKNYIDDIYPGTEGDITTGPVGISVGNNSSQYDNITIRYDYTGGATNQAYAILAVDSDFENTASQAKRRIAPLLTGLTVNDSTPAGYQVTVDVDGYYDDYELIVALFDCVTVDDTCAQSYSSKLTSEQVSVGGAGSGTNSYDGVPSNPKTFTVDFTDDVTFSNTAVARIYYKPIDSEFVETNFISVIGAGGAGMAFTDSLGRKVIIAP